MNVPRFKGNIGFNAHHAPMGAYVTFTCGHPGTRGGLAAQLGKPAGQDLFIGVKPAGRYEPAPLRCLPFFDGAIGLTRDGAMAYTLERTDGQQDALSPYSLKDVARRYGWGTDRWETDLFGFSLYTPFGPIPDPATARAGELRDALLPALAGELEIDNRAGKTVRTAFFAINFNDGGTRLLDQGLRGARVGFALRQAMGVAAEVAALDGGTAPEAFPLLRWSVQQGLEDRANPVHLLGTHAGVAVEVPPGRHVTLRLAMGCHLAEAVTTRLQGRYLYARHFRDLPEVLNAALDRFDALKAQAAACDQRLLGSGLNADQQFLIAHATRSYYGNTQLLDLAPAEAAAPEPYWIVNEGEYCMMNTLDLAVDQVFWELEQNPWVVRNLLENFLKRYSYSDRVKLPAAPGSRDAEIEHRTAPGGLSFTHDQGAHNQFSPFGTSAYELAGLTGCFSYMTQEQVCNWILIAASYVACTGDSAWAAAHRETLDRCLSSMLAREVPGADARRDGIMTCDSALCGAGSEITTYDSLDASLGRARANLYLVNKCWAAYAGLARLLHAAGDEAGGKLAAGSARTIDRTLRERWPIAEGEYLPALLDEARTDARILPAIEALVYPLGWGEPAAFWAEHASLHAALKTHASTLLADPQRRNHFPDGGIRLSSTSENSWLSKIALVQHVARAAFNLDEKGADRATPGAGGWEAADAGHVRWLTTGDAAYWAASDQFVSGAARGSRYYPRLITTALWLRECGIGQ